MRKNQKYTKEQMYGLIRQCEQSKLPQEKFFKQQGIPRSTFLYWRKKYLMETSPVQGRDKFIPVKVSSAAGKNPKVLELVYPNGVRMVCPADMDLSRLKPLIVL
jgi:hypothetical protein